MKLAAIDIGSNAIRLLIVNAFMYNGEFRTQKDLMLRVPLRLGDQVFLDGKIHKNKAKRLIKTMKSFSHLMKVCDVEHYKACATSAMRDAKNGEVLVDAIKAASDIDIDIISGDLESNIIFESLRPTLERYPDRTFINVDVGGGSTELVIFRNAKIAASKSFNIGTVRLLNETVELKKWEELKAWIDLNISTSDKENFIGFGTGGNIRKISKLYFQDAQDHFQFEQLNEIYNHLNSLSFKERLLEMGLRNDRADVIAPASKIYRNVMFWAGFSRLYVPKVAGLSVGIIKELYTKHNSRKEEGYF